MKPVLFMLVVLGLAACSPEPSPPMEAGEMPPQHAPKPREPEDWEKYGMADSDTYRELLRALNDDDVTKALPIYRSSRMPLADFAEKSFTNRAGKCFRWALEQGYKPEVNAEFWDAMLPDWCCEVDEEEADKLYLVLIPLLNSQPELMLQEHFTRVMIYAAEFGCRKTMQHLLAIRAPADVMDADGLTPLDFALFYEYADIAAMLRAHGAGRHTPRPTARELWEAEERAAAELRQQVAAEYREKLRALKPGDPLPIMDVVPGPIHRPCLRSRAAKERRPGL